MNHTFQLKWIWINSLVFGVFAGFFKAAFFPYPEFNPPVVYPALIAFLVTVPLWGFLVEKGKRPAIFRGGTAGAIVGLVTPVLVWPVFLLGLALSEHRFPEIFLWSPVYMLISLQKIGWLTTLLGSVLAIALVQLERKAKVASESRS